MTVFHWLTGKSVKTKLTVVNVMIALINLAVIGYALSAVRDSVRQLEHVADNEYLALIEASRLQRQSESLMGIATQIYLAQDTFVLDAHDDALEGRFDDIADVIEVLAGYPLDRNALAGVKQLTKGIRGTFLEISERLRSTLELRGEVEAAWGAFEEAVSDAGDRRELLFSFRTVVQSPVYAERRLEKAELAGLADRCRQAFPAETEGGDSPCRHLMRAARSGNEYVSSFYAARNLLLRARSQFSKMNGLVQLFFEEARGRLVEKRKENQSRLEMLILIMVGAVVVTVSVIFAGHILIRSLVVLRVEAMRRSMAAWLSDRTPLPPADGADELAEMAHFTGKFVETIEKREGELKKTAERLMLSERDLTEARDHAEKALETERRLREEQQSFVSMLSHEFRTPLAIIDRAAQMISLKTTDRGENVRKRLIRIRQSTSKLSGLVDTFLAAQSFNAGNLTVTWSEIPVRHLFDILREELPDWSGQDRLRFAVHPQGAFLTGDEKLLGIALSNLVANALKYSPAESPVEVDAEVSESEVVISVRNQGPGMTLEEVSRAGKMYFRGKSSSGTSGTGLGLHIARRIAENHGGSLSITSSPGHETDVSLRLPLRGRTSGTGQATLPDMGG